MTHGPKIIVIAEDEVLIRMLAAEFLSDEGFAVIEAAGADEALAVLRSEEIDLLFTDIDMPGRMNGLELASRARAIRPDIAVLITSGKTRPSPAELPADSRFLSKPYQQTTLAAAIRQLMSGD